MKRLLPERPDLGQLKKQAKELYDAVHAGEPAAATRCGVSAQQIGSFALHDAQRALAREYGFPSWAKLKLHIETRHIAAAEERLIDAILSGDGHATKTILGENPALAERSLAVAAALGKGDSVTAHLARDPATGKTPCGPKRWEPLLYVCFGRCGDGDGARAEIARGLLAGGANPNSFWIHPTWPESPLPGLYGACGVNDYPQLARVLLQAGANPNDGESRYHAAEHHHVACLEALKEFGADLSAADKTWGNTPLCFLLGYVHPPAAARGGVHWLLQNGANPNVRSYQDRANETPLHVAVRNDWDLATIALLLEHGADLNARRADGRSAYALAVIFGRDRIADLLVSRGAETEISAVDALLGACMRGDAVAVRTALRESPGLGRDLASSDFNPAEVAARENRAGALTLLAEAGFDVTKPVQEGATPLHWAAWHGRADAVRILLRAGADREARDTRFNAPPLGWCAHGSQFCREPAGDYAAVAETLISAGVFVSPEIEASPEVMSVVRKHFNGTTKKP